MPSNPVQIRIDDLVERWNLLREPESVRLIRILHRKDEEDMVSTFLTYLLSEDAPNPDIPILFDRHFDKPLSFTKYMLMQLHGLIGIWNHAKNPDGSFNESIDWEPDFSYRADECEAALFVRNFNAFADFLELPDGVFLLAIFQISYDDPRSFEKWVKAALEAGISPKVRLLITDRTDQRYFDRLISADDQRVKDLVPDLNVDQMMSQVAAMGDPTDPVIQYRKALVALMEAVTKRKSKAVGQHAREALRIANEQAKSEPLWFGQVLVVHSLLCNDQIGYKNWKKAISHATDGVEQMQLAEAKIKESYIARKFIAQALMTRGAVYTADKQWDSAHLDFSAAAALYVETHDFILAVEAHRMDGYVLHKAWKGKEACQTLCEGFQVGRQLPTTILIHTSFAGLVEAMIRTPYTRHLDQGEVQEFLIEVYGEDWKQVISKWKVPDFSEQSGEISELVQTYT